MRSWLVGLACLWTLGSAALAQPQAAKPLLVRHDFFVRALTIKVHAQWG